MGEMATKRGRYPAEVRERAVRRMFEHPAEHGTQWAAITSIPEKFGMSAQTLRKRVRQAEVDVPASHLPRADDEVVDPQYETAQGERSIDDVQIEQTVTVRAHFVEGRLSVA